MKSIASFVLCASLLGSILPASAQMKMISDNDLLAELKGAAPESVLEHATILNMGTDGKMKTIKAGTNGWTCMDPGNAPMCGDQGAVEWMQALVSKGPAPQKLGFIYMLKGDNGASNTDPYAKGETPDNNWIRTGSHVMIVGGEAKAMLAAYPREAKADPRKPYVMWPGTPYEHLMLPVE